ncbi:DUF1549 domain-containing protein [Fuerstiella marisgermanici]|uniref:Bacterial Ig-like domain (Group 2) n=1 Tax=Fuerstiella marisgermanici TaxID=1891926 RepID=A0A1P8WIW5_9PLAN|nr:DUF1549 domain-containing protein [Fuerstiella marisgermanici]APZ93996.1 Bacterial Ig-like domain (group 2) [Fuerstiella marisgermanici]
MKTLRLFLTPLMFAVVVAPASADEAPKPASIIVSPTDIDLSSARDRQSLLVQAVMPNGLTFDVTDKATLVVENPAFIKQDGQTFHPVADGVTKVAVSYAGHAVDVPVKVANSTVNPPLSFRLDVMPVFMKTSCNNGSCHGAARGKDGFALSLFGFDPAGDHHRITREIPGRRINLALPEESLLVEKAAGLVPHTGGKRFDVGGEKYNTLVRWLKEGAPDDPKPAEVPKVVEVELFPKTAVLDGDGETQRLTVRAKYSDGTDRDVTSLAYFSSNNETAAEITQEGIVTGRERGEAFIMARFDTHTVGSNFIVLPKGLKYEDPKTPEFNYIDTLVHNKLRKLRITPSEVCSDPQFLRRVFIDITGTLPSAEEHEQFLADTDPQKREKVVDQLLQRKEFVDIWVMKWAELLQVRTITNRVAKKPMLRYFNWLKEKIASNTPTDVMVRELLASKGGTFSDPATNYYQTETETLKVAENAAQVFMGMRIQCTQCHNHPFDRWTMDDYYGFAAFFSQIGRKRAEDPREQIIFNSGRGEVKHPVGGRNMAPKFLGGETPDLKGRDRREVLAEWLASPDNPYFATNLANIVWAHFFGKGIIDQVDDVRVSNPPVNAELLAELGKRFTDYNYDFRRLVRDICTSRTYQLSTQTNPSNETDHTNFAHAELRRLRAEVMLDCITQVTSTVDKFAGLPVGARAVHIADGNTSTYFLTTFGRAKRESVCSCEVQMEPNLSQALHLMNGTTVNSKIQQGGLIPAMLKEGKTPAEVITELYLRCFTRKPTEAEMAKLLAVTAEDENPQQPLEDIFWSLLNSREFLFNH